MSKDPILLTLIEDKTDKVITHVELDYDLVENLKALAKTKNISIEDLIFEILMGITTK